MTSTAVAPTNAAAAQFTSPTRGGEHARRFRRGRRQRRFELRPPTSSAAASSISINGGLASLAGNFQSFLTLLTTQLQNQDPLNPTDTNQFTQQITQMTGVEQQLISNQLLQQLVSQQTGVSAAAEPDRRHRHRPWRQVDAIRRSAARSPRSAQSNGQTMLTVGDNQVPLVLDHRRDRNRQPPRRPPGRLTDIQ